MKSFRPSDGGDDGPPAGHNVERDFRDERRSNATRASRTDGDARSFRKGAARYAPGVWFFRSDHAGRRPPRGIHAPP